MEYVLKLVTESEGPERQSVQKIEHGELLKPHLVQVCPSLVSAIFKLIEAVPINFMQDNLHRLLAGVRSAFPAQFPGWMELGLSQLPASVASEAQKQEIRESLARGGSMDIDDTVRELSYRCEQVALRNRADLKGPDPKD